MHWLCSYDQCSFVALANCKKLLYLHLCVMCTWKLFAREVADYYIICLSLTVVIFCYRCVRFSGVLVKMEDNKRRNKGATSAESFHDDDSFAIARPPLTSINHFTDSPDVSQKVKIFCFSLYWFQI